LHLGCRENPPKGAAGVVRSTIPSPDDDEAERETTMVALENRSGKEGLEINFPISDDLRLRTRLEE